jgi:hypothetical protein
MAAAAPHSKVDGWRNTQQQAEDSDMMSNVGIHGYGRTVASADTEEQRIRM